MPTNPYGTPHGPRGPIGPPGISAEQGPFVIGQSTPTPPIVDPTKAPSTTAPGHVIKPGYDVVGLVESEQARQDSAGVNPILLYGAGAVAVFLAYRWYMGGR